MSYDIYLTDPVSGDTLQSEERHQMGGGTRRIGGTRDLWLNVTWNYREHFVKALGEEGIRTIYGRTGAEVIPILKDGIEKLGDDVDDNYWASTEGNAKRALNQLLAMARMRPEGVFQGD